MSNRNLQNDNRNAVKRNFNTAFVEEDGTSTKKYRSTKFPDIRVKNMKTFMDPKKYEFYMLVFFDKLTQGNSMVNELAIKTFERLYEKYFDKEFQQHVIVIANIMHTMHISIEKFDANKKAIAMELKEYFTKAILLFKDCDFEMAFMLMFHCVYSINRVVSRVSFKDQIALDNLISVLKSVLISGLKSSKFQHSKAYEMLLTQRFESNYKAMKYILKDVKNSDPGITKRMPFVFKTKVNTRKRVQTVSGAVTKPCQHGTSVAVIINAYPKIINFLTKCSTQNCTKPGLMACKSCEKVQYCSKECLNKSMHSCFLPVACRIVYRPEANYMNGPLE